jgi:endonuclease YncB( thermonuclease family)
MSVRWDEEWEASMPARARPKRRLGVGAIFLVVLMLVALMVVATRWRHWIGGVGGANAITAADLKPSARDTDHGPIALCHGPVRITCVVDGDTIWYAHEKIRVADINAPEISHPQCDYELALGDKARDRLVVLLNAGPFSLDKTESRDVDKYGRKLRSITRGGKSVGAVLVNEGLAETWVGHRRDWCH